MIGPLDFIFRETCAEGTMWLSEAFRLSRLLVAQRSRKTARERGWLSLVVLGGLLSTLIVIAAVRFRRLPQMQASELMTSLVAGLWVSLYLLAFLTGIHLTWRIDLEKLLWLPASFRRLYGVGVALSFVSLPVGVGLLGWILASAEVHLLQLVSITVGWSALLLLSRLPASGLRFAVRERYGLGFLRRAGGIIAGVLPAVAWLASAAEGEAVFFIRWMTRLLEGKMQWNAFLGLFVLSAAYLALEYGIQRQVLTYGGTRSTGGRPHSRVSSGWWFSRLNRPLLLRRLCLLGLLRTQYSSWAWVVGFLYPLLWQSLAQEEVPVLTVVAYCGIVLLPHSAYRGNLFGMDRCGAWAYPLLGVWGEELVRAKNSALTFLQSTMMLGAVLPAFLPSLSRVHEVKQWIYMFGFAWMILLLNEAAGVYFSVGHPESIDSKSRYSGSTTPGALIICSANVVLTAIYATLSEVILPDLTMEQTLLLLLPLPIFYAARKAAYRWVRQVLKEKTEGILYKLSLAP